MKRALIYFMTGLTLLVSQACHKPETNTGETVVNETVSININASETYRYMLPVGFNNETSYFENTGSASATLSVETNTAGSAFIYTPPQNFSGNDVIVINNVAAQSAENNHHGQRKSKRHKHGGCSKEGSKHSITFNITVSKANN